MMEPSSSQQAPKKPKKGILKKTSSTTKPAPDPSIVPRAEAARLALQHAKILEDRKKFEAHILDCLIQLAEFPRARSPAYTAANPADADAAEFKALVRTFQPSDFDDLIEERNVNGLCGYVLCPKPHVQYGGGKWKIYGDAIVEKKDLEKWCSQTCARRAMYVKAQLIETAAWERVGIPNITIDLMDENPKSDQDKVADKIASLQLSDDRKAKKNADALALERESTGRSIDVDIGVDVNIREKKVTAKAEPPSLGGDYDDDPADSHLFVEGYRVRLESKTPQNTNPGA